MQKNKKKKGNRRARPVTNMDVAGYGLAHERLGRERLSR
jgi:hypothetical protein